MHDALGVAGGARGEKHRRHVVGLAGGHRSVEEARVRGLVGRAGGDQGVDAVQARLAVVAQAARVIEPDLRELRTLRPDFEQLVDLLLVFDDGEGDLGVVERENELGDRRILVQRHGNRTERLRRQHRGVQARPVLAHDHQVLALAQSGGGQATGNLLHQRGQVAPGQRLPDAVFLLAQGRRIRALRGMVQHQSREGGLHREVSVGPCGEPLRARC